MPLNAVDRSGASPNDKPSFTVDQAAEQLDRAGLSWNSQLGQPATVTYAFRATAPGTLPDDTGGFSQFTPAQIHAAQLSLEAWSDVADITFQRVGSGDSGPGAYSNDATILFSDYSTGSAGAAAFTYLPGSTAASASEGDVWVNSTQSENISAGYTSDPSAIGGYGLETLTHEIGHAIGLSHPSDYDAGDGTGDITYEANASYYEDSREYSIMSYFASSNTGGQASIFAVAPQLDDIAAAQRLYGVNMTTRAGDDVYGFHSNLASDGGDRPWYELTSASDHIYAAIWDGGGNDTLDFSLYGQNQLIDLREGNFSNVGGDVGNISIAIGAQIENALGGSGADTLQGNALANHLYGGAGADSLTGDAGADSLDGGAGADTLTGGDGADVFVFSAVADSPASAPDTITDFTSGVDKLDLSAVGYTSVNFDPATGLLTDATAAGTLEIVIHGAFDPYADILGRAASALAGGAGPDTLVGGSGDDVITGGGGGDHLTGGGGVDTFRYLAASDSTSAGFDIISDFQTGSDKIDLSAVSPSAVNVLEVGGGTAFVFVQTPQGDMEIAVQGALQPADFVTGNAGLGFGYVGSGADETFVGGAGLDAMNGGGGNDVLIGGAHGDVLTGGDGADVFRYLAASDSTSASPDTLTDFQTGVDKIDLTAVAPAEVNILYAAGSSFLFIPAGGIVMQIGVTGQVAFSDLLTGEPGLGVNVIGSDAPERIVGSDTFDALNGGAGDDTLIGGAHGDVLTGGAGADTFRYLAASDSTPQSFDTIDDFQPGVDKLDISALHTPGSVYNYIVSGGATYVFVDQGGDGTNDALIALDHTTSLHASDVIW